MQLAASGLPFVRLKHIIPASSSDGLGNSCVQSSRPPTRHTGDLGEILAHPLLVAVNLSFTILEKRNREEERRERRRGKHWNLKTFKPKS